MSHRPGAVRAAGRHRPGIVATSLRPAASGAPSTPEPQDTPGAAVTMGVLGIGMLVAAAVWPVPDGEAPAPRRVAASERQVSLGETGAPLVVASPGTPPERTPVVSCEPLGLRERVAQTLLAGIPGTTMSDEIERIVTRHAGSVLLFTTNIASAEQVTRLTRAMRRAAPRRLLVAVDEEGGRVSRLGAAGLVERLPSARTLAATEDVDQVREMATRLGREMRRIGVDWNLAPVLDVTDAPSNTVIGDRSFAADTETAAAYGRAFAEGMRAAGVLTTGKHFPGEGGTAVDPHETLPTLSVSLDLLMRRDVAAFAAAAPALDAVMSAHVVYPALDAELPAGLSPATVDLLRQDVGFEGVLMTDALEMDAITERWEVPEAAEMAIRAGSDVVLVGRWPDVGPTSARIRDAVRSKRISPERLDEAAGRVLAMKGHAPEEVACLLA